MINFLVEFPFLLIYHALSSCSKCCMCHFQDPICVCNIQAMESETEDQEIIVMGAWSVSEYCHSSEDVYISESRDGSYNEERKSDTELPVDLQHTHIRQADHGGTSETTLQLQPGRIIRGLLCQILLKHPFTDSPKDPTSPRPEPQLVSNIIPTVHLLFLRWPELDDPNSYPWATQGGRQEAGLWDRGQGEWDGQPRGDGRRLGSGTGARGNGSVESPEEGGHSETPPAYLSFGISAQGAEQAEEWDSASERDLPSPSRHRVRHARPRQSKSQSDKQVNEANSKCKSIALLLTDAPNPRNRGVLMFKKQRQRVKNYTLVSYRTGQHQFDDKNGEDIESEDGKTVRFTLTTKDYSELEEDYSMTNLGIANIFQHLEEMERLPETRGKGVAMFAQRRQRMDEIALEHEEMRCKGLPGEGIVELEDTELHKSYKMDETYVQSNHAHGNQQLQCKENQQEVQQCTHMMNRMPNHLSSAIPKPLVPNRTAKPFLGSQNRVPIPFSPLSGVTSPVKHHELKFKVSVPTHTVPQVWSPTGDFIASRDERISVPAIKTGILLDSKRRGANRASSDQASNAYIQNRGERRSYIESGEEEDYFSLGAEACNFMQPRKVKHKYPPPVAPKPSINPACPPWLKESSSNVLLHPGPIPASFPSPVGARPQPPMKITYSHAAKAPSTSPMGHISEGHVSPAINGPTLRGRGAELFATRKTRMEKYVVDAETVQANKAKSPSPTTSLPGAWRYSSNVRAPSPLSYNPRHAPCYPPAGAKQPPSTSPKIKPKTKAKTKPPPHKHMDALDVLKHQPYQLDSSLFRYNVGTEAEGLSPSLKMPIAPAKSTRSVSVLYPFGCQSTQSSEPLPFSKQLVNSESMSSIPFDADVLSRGTIQMAPRPTFSAKKQAVTTKQWRHVILQH
uniref:Synaptopodin 2 n=1 Tax=Oncorhynchus mykiss TaxID=8022 RepID=A0A8K9UJR5_ONCMY